MSGIVLSASVRQNLLSLQSTASLLATTQNDLATGNAVNSALDNPTNFFTAQSLNTRASDIGNLLDSIGNGVQVLQAANTGITSLQSLISSAQSIANQVLQAPTGFSTKSQVTSTAITGATADNLLGTTGSNATAVEGALQTGGNATATATTSLAGAQATLTGSAVPADSAAIGAALQNAAGVSVGTTTGSSVNQTGGTNKITATTALVGANAAVTAAGFTNNDTFNVNGKAVTFVTTAPPTTGTGAFTQVNGGTDNSGNVFVDANGNVNILVGGSTAATVNDVLTGIDLASGVQTVSGAGTAATGSATVAAGQTASSVANGQITLANPTGSFLSITAASGANGANGLTDLTNLGLNTVGTLAGTSATITGTLNGTAAATPAATTLSSLTGAVFANGENFTVNGNTVTFESAAAPSAGGAPAGFTKVTTGLAADSAAGTTTLSGNVFFNASTGAVQIFNSTSSANVGDVLTAIDLASGVQTLNTTTGTASLASSNQTASSVDASGVVTLESSTNAPLNIVASNQNSDGTANGAQQDLATTLGLTASSTTTTGAKTTDTFTATPAVPSFSFNSLISAGSTLTVDNHTITFANSLPTTTPNGSGVSADKGLQTDGNGNSIVSLQSGSIQDVLDAIDLATGAQTAKISGFTATLAAGTGTAATITNGALTISTGANPLTIAGTGNALTALGLTAATTPAPAPISSSTLLTGATNALANNNTNFKVGDTLNVNGNTVSFVASAPATGFTKVTGGTDTSGNVFVNASGDVQVVAGATTTVGDVLTGIDLASGVQAVSGAGTAATGSANAVNGQTASSVSATGKVTLESSIGSDLNITASNSADLTSLGLAATTSGGNAFTAARTASSSGIGSLITAGSSLNVDGKTITFVNTLPATTPAGSGVDGAVQTDGNGNSIVSLQSGTIQDVLNAIDLASGVQTASIGTGANAGKATLSTTAGDVASSIDGNGKLNLSTGTQNLTIAAGSGNALAALGLTAGTTADSSLQGQTLNIASTEGGTATSITFGTDAAAGQVSTLNQLNADLASNNLQASISTTGQISITTTNNAASATIGQITGTATASGSPFANANASISAPVVDPNSQATRESLVSQYNTVIQQINTTAQDSSFNGINLLNGDTLSLTFDETGDSKLSIQGVTFNAGGLGLSTLTSGTDFLDNNSANAVLSSLQNASTQLQTEGSALGSNLSIVKIRQDFNQNLINVLQTGASNLTLADPNQEAANSQALSTRQSIAVSALALANQSQQSVLQLLR
jgi:hypothetical protein